MCRIALRTLLAGTVSLLCPWISVGGDALLNAGAVFSEQQEPLVQPISGAACCAPGGANDSACCSPGGSGGCFDSTCGGYFRPFVGVEATFLHPNISGNVSSATLNGESVGGTKANGFYAAPRIWAGAGIGDSPFFGQLRYWQLNGSQSNTLTGPTFGSTSGTLDAYVFDFELGSRFTLDCCDATGLFTFGGRYVNWQQSSTVGSYQLPDPSQMLSATASGASQFDGTGLTFGYLLDHQIGCSNWSVFGSNRYSWIWGNQSSAAMSSATSITSPIALAASANGATASADSTLFIAEFQLGTQWKRELKCINGDAFLRLAFEYQYWNTNSDSQAVAGSFASSGPPPADVTAAGGNGPLGMSLYGLAVSTGVNW